ncbi:MAG: TRAP transporter large permease subunit [Chloroflexota bacterium]|nr:TRAP transporter large permease subunit [Chloroflexota bacterium]
MEWQYAFLVIFGSLAVLLIAGVPVAFAFMIANIIGILIWWGGEPGLRQLILSTRQSVSSFVLLPVPLFILMGEVMFQSGVGIRMILALDKWLGRLPGRLSLLTVGAGTVFATMSGSSMASAALLGSVLIPEMDKRGYHKSMSLGPVLGSGGLAIMIPPSSLAVVLGGIAEISVGKLLMGIIIPGLIMAVIFSVYIILRAKLQPQLAPVYDVAPTPFLMKLSETAKYVLPLGLIIFLVIGLMFLGVATPSEAAAAGTLGAFILAAVYKNLNFQMVKKSVLETAEITVMVFLIMTGATAFSQILAFSGATRGLIDVVTTANLAPIVIIIGMHIVLLFLGCFINVIPIIMITMPMFMPIIDALGLNPVWMGVGFLLNLEMAPITPPFGLTLFVVKGVAPGGTTIEDCYRAAMPFIMCDLVALALIIAFPVLSLWLPQNAL